MFFFFSCIVNKLGNTLACSKLGFIEKKTYKSPYCTSLNGVYVDTYLTRWKVDIMIISKSCCATCLQQATNYCVWICEFTCRGWRCEGNIYGWETKLHEKLHFMFAQQCFKLFSFYPLCHSILSDVHCLKIKYCVFPSRPVSHGCCTFAIMAYIGQWYGYSSRMDKVWQMFTTLCLWPRIVLCFIFLYYIYLYYKHHCVCFTEVLVWGYVRLFLYKSLQYKN